ncbi:ribonucleotide-diphosphate reductase subunit beta [Cupriavidus metallidurans]|uniref:ribonucleotide-diphosphate reductase subunit beta n=1 Tax=Cupriavidus metallidurans TaxID=119219 RepID=UPI001F1C8A56|nr:ribonucleotide-diphosphate reductase subunit beta [Cupriavidus metallidurans]
MKHNWARSMWKEMQSNDWTVQEVQLTDDKLCYNTKLLPRERVAFDKALAFVSNLDGIQLHNISENIMQHVTSPEVKMCLTRQAYEEALHVEVYSAIIETLSADPMEVYMTFERDGMLAQKNEHILRQSRILRSDPSPAQFARAIVANVGLEGIYFYDGFLAFYNFAANGKMTGSADGIKLINRDEIAHLKLFTLMHQTMKRERPELYDAKFVEDAVQLLADAAELEAKWGKHIISGGIPGLTDQIMDAYPKHRANECAAMLELPLPFPGVKDPAPWVVQFSKPGGGRENTFESKVTEYSKGTLSW